MPQRPDPPYAAHAVLSDPARRAPALWRLVLGTVLTGALVMLLGQSLFAAAEALLSPSGFADFEAAVMRADTPVGLYALLFVVGGLGLGAMLAARGLHHRPARSLFGGRPLRLGLRCALFLIVLNGAVFLLPPWTLYDGISANLSAGLWLALLPLSLLAVLIQTGAEELFFSGYLQSQLAARFRHPLIWIGLPSALFALGHHAPDLFGPNAIWVTLWAFAFGVAMADLTARTGSLGPAMAVHFVNNTGALLLVSMQGDMSGLALYTLPFTGADTAAVRAYLPVDLAMIGLSWLTVRLALRV
ncbi:CPBP family intramembrane glutamic endopeptidase [Thalassococcus profundi]|uniref:CPBP family intramembrane glutamic endopeptidase n=1 Tax=Thalassococcus profundi TaxID=2282382 RepID=UPI0040592C35